MTTKLVLDTKPWDILGDPHYCIHEPDIRERGLDAVVAFVPVKQKEAKFVFLAAFDLLAACEDALIATIGGKRECDYCVYPLDGTSPYSNGEHGDRCWVPKVLSAVKLAKGIA